jgi:hypothetical protein
MWFCCLSTDGLTDVSNPEYDTAQAGFSITKNIMKRYVGYDQYGTKMKHSSDNHDRDWLLPTGIRKKEFFLDINTQSRHDGETPLTFAAELNNHTVMSTLVNKSLHSGYLRRGEDWVMLENAIDLGAPNAKGETPLVKSVLNKDIFGVRLFTERRYRLGDKRKVQKIFILQKINLNISNKNFGTSITNYFYKISVKFNIVDLLLCFLYDTISDFFL